jgi:hypothetical protein
LKSPPPQFPISIQCSASVVIQNCSCSNFILSCQHAYVYVLSVYHALLSWLL